MGQALDALVGIGVLAGLFILVYCKWTNRTLLDVFRGIREAFSTQTETVEMDWR